MHHIRAMRAYDEVAATATVGGSNLSNGNVHHLH